MPNRSPIDGPGQRSQTQEDNLRPAAWLGLPPRVGLIAAMIFGAAALRLLPHPVNFAPIGAMALFGGAHLPHRGWNFALPFAIPLAAMLLSDAALEASTGWGFHRLMPAVYGSFALIVTLGFLLRRGAGVLPVFFAALGAASLFFLITNFAVWALLDTYPSTAAGLAACYLAALPFFWNTLAGDLFYSAVLFGGFALAARGFPMFAAASPPRGEEL